MQSRANEAFASCPGFSVIELLAVMVMLAILAALSLPSYQDAVRRAKRAEAWATLLKNMQQQERYYSRYGSYAAFSALQPQGFTWHSGSTPQSSAYEISATACEGHTLKHCVILTAEPGGRHVQLSYADPACGALSLDSAGVRAVSGAGDSCW